MIRAKLIPEDDRAAFEPLRQFVREERSGEVPESVHRRGKERLLVDLALDQSLEKRRPMGLLLLVAATCALAALLFVAWPAAPLGYAVEGGSAGETGYVTTGLGAVATVHFTDGTDIALIGGGRGRIAEVTARGARVVLEHGMARVRVVHRSSARWSVEAGPFEIVVTGTAFDVRWSPEGETLDLGMREGTVVVRGPAWSRGVEVSAGQHLRASKSGDVAITAETADAGAAARVPDAADAGAAVMSALPSASSSSVAAAVAPGPPPPRPATPPSWSTRVAEGDFKGVLADAEARGLGTTLSSGSLADLDALADAARYARRQDLARLALLAVRRRFPGSPASHNAAFSLGRMADAAEGPAAAIVFYDHYLAEAPGGPLAAEALGRKMEALLRASGPEAARTVAQEYLRRYPEGPYAKAAASMVRPEVP